MQNIFENEQYQSVFNQKNVRKNFTRKVFSLVGIQLFATFVLISLFRSCYLMGRISDSLQILAIIGSFATAIVLGCSRDTARSYPKNYVFLSIFTFCEAVLLDNFLAYYDSGIIFQAGFMTALTLGLLGGIATFSNIDFTSGKALGLLLGAQFICLIFGFLFFSVHSVLYSIISLFIFCGYCVLDLQMIMGSKSAELQIDDYVYASIMLYTDIIQIFIKLVVLLSDKDDKRDRKRQSKK